MSDDFDASLYRLLHRGTPGDVSFYQRACAGARSVLELGCGDGRVLGPIGTAGADVVGLDAHPEMVEAARRRWPEGTWQVGDMLDFDLGRRFDRVIVPYTGLYCVPDDDALVACLGHVRRHLAPGGRLLFDAYVVDRGMPSDRTPPPFEPLISLVDGGRQIAVEERSVHDADARRFEVTYRHRIREGGRSRVVAYTLSHHYLFPDELPELLAAAGLALLRLDGDFAGGPFDPVASERLVCEAGVANGGLERGSGGCKLDINVFVEFKMG